MAREQRKDVDYFPHPCGHGRKMSIIQGKYGNDGYATWFKLLEELGKANNHYIDISEETTLMYLAINFRISEDLTLEILNDLAKLGAIDKFLFENHKVIWSQKFANSIEDAYRNRKGKIFQYSDILNEISAKNGQSYVRLTAIDTNLAEVIPKVKKSKVKESKEEKIYINPEEKIEDKIEIIIQKEFITESEFIEIWKRARLYYDKQNCGFDKLLPFEKQNFKSLVNIFSKKQFECAIAGLFFQDTLPTVRVRPDWILQRENFEKMLDCWINKNKIFDKSKKYTPQGKTEMFQKGDV